jgi:hypothetical protein
MTVNPLAEFRLLSRTEVGPFDLLKISFFRCS